MPKTSYGQRLDVKYSSTLFLAGKGQSPALAEVCCSMLLAGELSIIGALTAGDFAKAHKRLTRDWIRYFPTGRILTSKCLTSIAKSQ